MLSLNAIYNSIIGDGLLVGQPATFLEFDDWTSHGAFKPVSVAGLVEHYLEPNFSKAITTCFMGATHKQDNASLLSLVGNLHTFNRQVMMETDASVWMPTLVQALDWISITPALPSYYGAPAPDLEAVNHYLSGAHYKMEVKFTVKDEDDIQAVFGFVTMFYSAFRRWRIPLILIPHNNDTGLGRRLASNAANTDLNVRIMARVNTLFSMR